MSVEEKKYDADFGKAADAFYARSRRLASRDGRVDPNLQVQQTFNIKNYTFHIQHLRPLEGSARTGSQVNGTFFPTTTRSHEPLIPVPHAQRR